MMHNTPNNPEYCQGIYEAAKRVVQFHRETLRCIGGDYGIYSIADIERVISELERALEGKP